MDEYHEEGEERLYDDDDVADGEEGDLAYQQAEAEAEAEAALEAAAEGAEPQEGQERIGGDETADKEPSGDAPTRTLKKPLSAYFLFAAAIRPTILAELDAAAAAEATASGTAVKSQSRALAVVGKIVGERWKAMTDEEKEVYTAQAAAAKEEYDEAIRRDPSLKGVRASKEGGSGGGGSEFVLPLGRIRKILDLDPEKGKLSKEALSVTEKATEHFLMWLATRTHLHASGQKRKGLRAQDVEHLVRTNTRLEFLRAPLKRDFERFAAAEAVASDARKARMEEMQRRKRQKGEEEAAAAEVEGEGDADAEAPEGEATDDHTSSPSKRPADKSAKPKPKPTRTIDSMFSRV